MKKIKKTSKKDIFIFSLLLLLILFSIIFMFIKFPKKVGYAYKVQFLQPHISKDEIIKVISSIDSTYLEGIHTIEIVDIPLNYEGAYILGGKIRLNVRDGFRKEVLFHELKHHYCWRKEKYLGHEGCFKEPPLIVEATVRDEIVVHAVLEEKIPTCFDDIQNQDETDVDCGGPCVLCEKETIEMLAPFKIGSEKYALIGAYFLIISIILIIYFVKKKQTI